MAQVHEDSLRRAREYFRSAEVAACIQQTPVSELFPLRQVYSTPDKYASSRTPPPLGTCATRVTLIGDALHAMTTHRGMGANTAIEDAADLADFLLQHPSAWREGLTTLERKITIRGFANVASSLKSTRMLHARGVLALARNWLMWGVGWGISIFFFVRGIFSRRRK